MEKDAKYYARRAQEERQAAKKAKHAVVRKRHLEMADAYELRLRSVVADESRQMFHLVRAV